MASNGNWTGGVGGGYVTKEELKQFGVEIAQAMAKANRDVIDQINKAVKAFNALREELGTAQNTTAELVDALALHLEACMEKLGLSEQDETGRTEVTQEFKDYCAARIEKANQFNEAQKGGVN